ncbi:thiamine pyrophosphate-dependent enzyme [Sulfuritalea hydrogenivorans]|uniref:Thiamine pyrophosphate enzyme, C-terminal TPP binding domain-containing protein 11 n=1 Tax=Sulfuritalea hydrogenivorans sk43H TaxID=1223802 RepID=W0SAV6_9PROT|nr:thiamine pyrophosphate-dependent enzyme [Sulfuritalea hydrogenivorans]BAO28329.1 thiamine pyrophosphate enzyme, C-terminal TPP binding domain-containing protein 11 [Sulfuritalea hydrogenivorans sk43H]
MNIVQACGVVAKGKGNAILVSTMLSMFIFDRIEGADGNASLVPTIGGMTGLVLGLGVAKAKSLVGIAPSAAAQVSAPGRINSVPLMGGAAGLGLGLALAKPKRKVIVMDGDASLLMELGSLATVAAQKPTNLLHCVVHNGTQFTGLDNMEIPVADFRFSKVAGEAGYKHSERISDGAQWAERFPALLAMEGPVFVELMVEPVPRQTKDGFEHEEMPDRQFTRMAEEALAMQAWLALDQT